MSAIGADLRAWAGFAGHWIANADRIARLTEGATDALIATLRPESGQRLLDVAAGVGDPSLRLAAIVGPTGHVMATDGVADMCTALARRAGEARLHQLAVRHAPAEALELPAGSFDAACCRFGAMFWEDPLEAARRMRHAVRPDGRLVLAVWGDRQANPYFTIVMEALDELGAPPLPLPPGSRTVFEFSRPAALLDIVRQAGWRHAREDVSELSMDIPATTPDTLLDTLASLSTRVVERLELLDPALRAAARAAVARRGKPFVRGPHVVFPARILLISGQS